MGDNYLRKTPISMGWMRRSDLDTAVWDVWEMPDGGLQPVHKGASLTLIINGGGIFRGLPAQFSRKDEDDPGY